MATFKFNIHSQHSGNKDFRVSVSTRDSKKDYHPGDSDSYTLEESQHLIFKFENSDPKHAYINWDDDEDKANTRHHLKDIKRAQRKDFKNKNYPFTLSSHILSHKLSWKVTNDSDGLGDETVNVTFGEDQPDELPHNK